MDTPDVTLSCAVAGEGPVVIAVHGFPDSRSTFFPLLPAPADHKVVMPALRGYAPSGIALSGRHDAGAAAEDILRLADRFSPGAPVKVIGHDWGAFAAFGAANMAPERVSHLVSMAVPHPAAIKRVVSPKQIERSWYVGMFHERGQGRDPRSREAGPQLLPRDALAHLPREQADVGAGEGARDPRARRGRRLHGRRVYGGRRALLHARLRAPHGGGRRALHDAREAGRGGRIVADFFRA